MRLILRITNRTLSFGTSGIESISTLHSQQSSCDSKIYCLTLSVRLRGFVNVSKVEGAEEAFDTLKRVRRIVLQFHIRVRMDY
mmetsp:Transcript_8301/g.19042  ORF Transcript_8301/g.19042 Transcript_8301/m.19042 type:complete len:83 (-) Transcript_8301:539-787(-)